jgi:nitrile hydratase subunit beta
VNGVHDMGGMHGLGPVDPEADEPIFHHDWEARVLALTLASGAWGKWNIDAGRHARERIPGPDYLRMSYYEKWFTALLGQLTDAGLVTPDELAAGRAAPGAPKASPPLTAERVPQVLMRGGSYLRAGAAPAFRPGDRVRARNLNPQGHTRLPRYVRGRIGVVEQLHGAHVFPDSNAHFRGEAPQPLYGVRFTARELWGEDADPRHSVSLDLWESYLERA